MKLDRESIGGLAVRFKRNISPSKRPLTELGVLILAFSFDLFFNSYHTYILYTRLKMADILEREKR